MPSGVELPPLVPRTPLGVFDEAITVLRLDPTLLFGIALAILLPLRVVALSVPGSPLRDARPDEILDIFVGNLSAPGAVLAAAVTLLFESLALFAVAAAYGEVLARWYAGVPITISDALVSSIRRTIPLVVAWTIVHLAEAVSALFTVGIGVLFVGPILIVTAPVIGAERAGPLRALRRSVDLTSSELVRAVMIFVTTGGGALLIRLMIESVPSVIGFSLFDLPWWAVNGVADVVATVVQLAFVAAAANVTYIDLRVRREGIDLYSANNSAFGETAVGSHG